MFLWEAVGWAGTLCVLAAYVRATRGGMDAKVQVLNLIGAVGLLANATYHLAWPLVGLNMAWLLIAWAGMLKELCRAETDD